MIEGGQGASHYKTVRDAASGKFAAPKVPHLYGAVGQLVVIGGGIRAKALAVDFDARQASGYMPACNTGACGGKWFLVNDGQEGQCMGQFFLPLNLQTQAGGVEETTLTV